MYLAAAEVGPGLSSACAEGRTRLACLPLADLSALLGPGAAAELRSMVKAKSRGKCKRRVSILSTPELLALPRLASCEDFALVGHVITLGGFGTVATYKRNGVGVSCKFLGKKACVEAKMDARLLLERRVLAALGGVCACLPKVNTCIECVYIYMCVYVYKMYVYMFMYRFMLYIYIYTTCICLYT